MRAPGWLRAKEKRFLDRLPLEKRLNTMTFTPILAFAGVLLGKDWKAFLSIGWKGVLVSLLVIFGTFFTSGLIAQFMGAGTV